MIISLSGTHCTGKTTLFEGLRKELSSDFNVYFHRESGRSLKEQFSFLKNNEDGDFLSQFYFLSRNIQVLIEHSINSIVILDRCHLDTLIYSEYLWSKGKLSDKQIKVLRDMYHQLDSLIKVDRHFLLKPSFPLQEEWDRSLDIEFQKEIQDRFDSWKACHNNCEYLPDSLESRIETIKNYIISHKQKD